MKKLIIFDFDGTLVDSESLVTKAILKLFDEYGITGYTKELIFKEFLGKNPPLIVAELQQIIKHVSPQEVDEKIKEYVRDFFENGIEPYSDVFDCLLDLDQYAMCIASNGALEYISYTTTKLGLSKFFPKKHIFTYEMVPNPKPSPDVFLLALNTLGFQKSEAIIVEDSFIGITGAVNSGIDTFGIIRDKDTTLEKSLLKAGAKNILSSLLELKNFL